MEAAQRVRIDKLETEIQRLHEVVSDLQDEVVALELENAQLREQRVDLSHVAVSHPLYEHIPQHRGVSDVS